MQVSIKHYIVVQRHVKDRTSKGAIIARCDSEQHGREIVKRFEMPDYNVWVMSRGQYDKPFSE